MRRYRFPGEVSVPAKCTEPKECKPYITIKVCPPVPYIKDLQCRPNIYDRAIVHHVPESLMCTYEAKFLLETFSGLILIPRNLDKFCDYKFKDGEVVAVEAEIIQKKIQDLVCDTTCEPVCKNVCKPDCCTCESKCDENCNYKTKCEVKYKKVCECEPHYKTKKTITTNYETDTVEGAIPVKIFKIRRVWKFDKKTLIGMVLPNTDANGINYFIVREAVDLAIGTPFAKLVEGILDTQSYVINYELYNIMGVQNPKQIMRELEGKIIQAEYTDYGQETANRLGIPIVVFNYIVVG